jgi:hypothetical protein
MRNLRIIFIFISLFATVVPKRMEDSVAIELNQLLRSVALLHGVPETENDIRVYFNNSLADSAPDCPLSAPFYGCDADGL